MQFLRGNGKLLDHVQDECGQQSAAVSVEESVEASTDAVVVELLGSAAQKQRMERLCPFDDRIQGGTGDDEAAKEGTESGDGVEVGARIGRGKVVGEDVGQVQTREEAVDDGEGGHGLGIETEGTVALHGVDTSCCLLYITVNMGSVKGYS